LSRFKQGVSLSMTSGICYSFLPIFAACAYAGGANVLSFISLRFSLAAAIFLVYIGLRRRGIRLTGAQLARMALIGCLLLPLQSFVFLSSVVYISPAMATLLFYTYPVLVAVFSYFINHERLNGKVTAGIVVAFAGLLLVGGTSLGRVSLAGLLLSFASSILYAPYVIFCDRLLHQVDPVVTAGGLSLGTALATLLVGGIGGQLHFQLATSAWLAVIGCALVSTNLSIFLFFAGMRLVGPVTAVVVAMIEPFSTAFFSAVLLHRGLTWEQMAGGAVLLLGAGMVAVYQGKAARERSAAQASR
jgi:drug/metabolite transporter (DMT)-like permease